MPLPQNLYCGPCGWSYPHWNGTVYPKNRSRGFHSLEFISRYFDAVEINTSFYLAAAPRNLAVVDQESRKQLQVSLLRQTEPALYA